MPEGTSKCSDNPSRKDGRLFCPSAQPGLDESMVLGVVNETSGGPRISYQDSLTKVPVGTVAAFLGSITRPVDVFRFAAPCEQGGCRNWDGDSCRVAERLVQILPAEEENLPQCALRPRCRWYAQEHAAACMRCSQVVTNSQQFEALLNGTSPFAQNL